MSHVTEKPITRQPFFPPKIPLGLRIGFWVCIAVGTAIVFRRALALGRMAEGSAPPELIRLDRWFQAHATLTYVHIFTALIFLCVLPFVFWTRTGQHGSTRWMYYTLGTAVGGTAFAMSTYSVGGWIERSAVLCFNTFFLFALGKSFRAWRIYRDGSERRWDLRASATVLGIATTRPVMGVFFATSRLTHWTPNQFFGPAFWIGFSINVIVMETWLRSHSTPGRIDL